MLKYLYLLIGISLLLSIYVSGSKNKMGSYKFSTICNKNSEKPMTDNFRLADVSHHFGEAKNPQDDFLFWFSGFTDAEGNFLITLDRGFVKFRLKVSLHIYDIEVLNTIKSKLNIGRVTVEVGRDRCSFIACFSFPCFSSQKKRWKKWRRKMKNMLI